VLLWYYSKLEYVIRACTKQAGGAQDVHGGVKGVCAAWLFQRVAVTAAGARAGIHHTRALVVSGQVQAFASVSRWKE
jgi:hypothetical protein